MVQQQELDPVRIFGTSVSAVLLDDGLTDSKETAKRTLIPAKCLIYKIRFLCYPGKLRLNYHAVNSKEV